MLLWVGVSTSESTVQSFGTEASRPGNPTSSLQLPRANRRRSCTHSALSNTTARCRGVGPGEPMQLPWQGVQSDPPECFCPVLPALARAEMRAVRACSRASDGPACCGRAPAGGRRACAQSLCSPPAPAPSPRNVPVFADSPAHLSAPTATQALNGIRGPDSLLGRCSATPFAAPRSGV